MTPRPALRKALRARREALAAACPEAAARAAAALPVERLPAFALVAGYRALGAEIDPAPLMARLAEAGARMALPVCVGRDAPLIFRLWSPGDPLVPDALGVPAPAPTAPEARPDLVITPLLAFDRRGGRMGQGGGHYDRTLQALRAEGAIFALGLAHAGQEVDRLDMEPHDQPLDAILTENGYIEVNRP